MHDLPPELTALANPGRPMGDERGANAPFLALMLVKPPGGVAGIGPGGAVADHAVGVPHGRDVVGMPQFISRGLRAEVDADTWLHFLFVQRREVEAERLPFG